MGKNSMVQDYVAAALLHTQNKPIVYNLLWIYY